jgi:hypothetical protein
MYLFVTMCGLEASGRVPAITNIRISVCLEELNTTRTVDRIAVFPASDAPTNTMLFARDCDLRRKR